MAPGRTAEASHPHSTRWREVSTGHSVAERLECVMACLRCRFRRRRPKFSYTLFGEVRSGRSMYERRSHPFLKEGVNEMRNCFLQTGSFVADSAVKSVNRAIPRK